jgi:hypothetical protein
MGMKRVGTILFVVGLVLSLLLGALADLFILPVIVAFFVIIVLFGITVGLMSTGKEETEEVLYTVAVVALVAMAATSLSRVAPDVFGDFVVGAAHGIIAYVLPIALVVASKRMLDLGVGF